MVAPGSHGAVSVATGNEDGTRKKRMQTAMTITMRRRLPCTHPEVHTTRQLDLHMATERSRRRLREPSFRTSTRIVHTLLLDSLPTERPLDILGMLGIWSDRILRARQLSLNDHLGSSYAMSCLRRAHYRVWFLNVPIHISLVEKSLR